MSDSHDRTLKRFLVMISVIAAEVSLLREAIDAGDLTTARTIVDRIEKILHPDESSSAT